MARRSRDPFEVRLSDEARTDLVQWLVQEVQAALDARSAALPELEYWHTLYEQARTRLAHTTPWPDAADLTSYIASEKVDALHARILRTIWVDPVWSVEGWGPSADRAPFVEEFHQWKAEEERLQGVLDRLTLISLIEPRGLLEVREGTELRPVRKTIKAKLQLSAETGGPLIGEDGMPLVQQQDGKFVEAQGEEPSADLTVDSWEAVRAGPQYRIVPYRNSVILPGHASDRDEIWGYGKRFWRRLPELQARADAGVYDAEAVAQLTHTGEREVEPALQRANQDIAPQEGRTAEKELWELLFLWSPQPREPERWYIATFHLGQQLLLRLQYDDLQRARFLPIILFPRSDRVTEGFSFVGHKLITVIEEHTAWRNMIADRATMVVQAPIKRLAGALWDPDEQPWGPKATIDVRDMREVEPVQIPDVPASVIERERTVLQAAERVAGINDIAMGTLPTEDRTLGEVRLAAQQSFVRMDLITRRFQEFLEELAQIRHLIWQRVLAEQGEGIEAPSSLLTGLESRGVSIDSLLPGRKITAQLLAGAFRFKPRGSVETADPDRVRMDFVQAMNALPNLIQAFPGLMPLVQQPAAGRAMFDQYLRVFRIANRQAFLGSSAPAAMGMGFGLPALPMMGMPEMPPGMGAGMAGPLGIPGGGPPGVPAPMMALPPAPMAPPMGTA